MKGQVCAESQICHNIATYGAIIRRETDSIAQTKDAYVPLSGTASVPGKCNPYNAAARVAAAKYSVRCDPFLEFEKSQPSLYFRENI